MPNFYIPLWKQAPFLRITIPFIAGIILANNLNLSILWAWISLGVFLIAFCLFKTKKISFQWTFGWIKGMLLEAVIGVLGVLVEDSQNYQIRAENLGNFYKKGDLVAAIFSNVSVKKNNLLIFESSSISLISKNRIVHPGGSIIITIEFQPGENKEIIPQDGDQILFTKPLQEINYPRNLASNVHQGYKPPGSNKFRVYLRKNEFAVIHADTTASTHSMLELTKDKILTTLKENIAGEREAGLAEALLVGYRQDLDREVLQSYANTGVVHIIAISGLHLALIFAILKFLMKPIYQRNSGKWIAAIVIIATLWAFSFLSGSSPSVLRSAVMFSILVLGENLRKHGSVYNGLFASAFILLCVNPSWFWDLGFQLSYLAVLSIVIFYKPIYQLIFVPWKIPNLIWQSVALTIAAQILTTPICILNFHQFPVYFLPANLLAVPLSSIILIGELLLCSISFLPEMAHMLGAVLTKMIWILNSYIDCISKLPFSTWNHLEISIMQTLVMYASIWGMATWIMKKYKSGLYISLVSACCWLAIRSSSFLRSFHQERLIVYNIPRHQSIDCIQGRQFIYFGDSAVEENISLSKFYLDPVRTRFRLREQLPHESQVGGASVFLWSKKKLLILNDSLPYFPDASPITFDLILLSKNCPVSISRLSKIFNKAIWIFDRSNSGKKLIQWKKECEELGLPYHDLAEKGAFVMNMD